MNKFKCTDCNTEFITNENICPNCGCPIEYCTKINGNEKKLKIINKSNIKIRNEINKIKFIKIFCFLFFCFFIGSLLPSLLFGALGIALSFSLSLIIALIIVNSLIKEEKKENQLYVDRINEIDSNELLEEALKRKEQMKKDFNIEETKQIEKQKEKQINDFDEWVKRVKNNKIFKDKDFVTIGTTGFLWYEEGYYYFYIIDTTKEFYNLGYMDGVIKTNYIFPRINFHTETINHNNKLKGAVIGGIFGGATGAIIGQNVENTTETNSETIGYYVEIDKAKIDISKEDYDFLNKYIEMNKKNN